MSLVEKWANDVGDYYIKALVDDFKKACDALLNNKSISFEDKIDNIITFKRTVIQILDNLDNHINYSDRIQKIIGCTIRNTKDVISYVVVDYIKKIFNNG